jgi:hypothetical protein
MLAHGASRRILRPHSEQSKREALQPQDRQDARTDDPALTSAASGSVHRVTAVEFDARGRRLRAALAAVLVRDNAPGLCLVRDWLDSWSGLGLIIAGMTHQGWDVQLTAYAARDWRANSLPVADRALHSGGGAWRALRAIWYTRRCAAGGRPGCGQPDCAGGDTHQRSCEPLARRQKQPPASTRETQSVELKTARRSASRFRLRSGCMRIRSLSDSAPFPPAFLDTAIVGPLTVAIGCRAPTLRGFDSADVARPMPLPHRRQPRRPKREGLCVSYY